MENNLISAADYIKENVQLPPKEGGVKPKTAGVYRKFLLKGIDKQDNRLTLRYENSQEGLYCTQTFWTNPMPGLDESQLQLFKDKLVGSLVDLCLQICSKEKVLATSATSIASFVEKLSFLLSEAKSNNIHLDLAVILDKEGKYTEIPSRKGAVKRYEDGPSKIVFTSWEEENRMIKKETTKPTIKSNDMPF